jgi:hypothetical protein
MNCSAHTLPSPKMASIMSMRLSARTDAILGLLHASGRKNQSMIAEQKIFDAAIETLMSLHTEVGDEPVLVPQDPAALASLIQWLDELNAGLQP